MRPLAVFLAFVALPVIAGEPPRPARPAPDWRPDPRMESIVRRAYELQPHRRDTPLRELNITDDEVREIQAIAAKHAMTSMLNISPVIAGCPCEEGPLCTDQVYVVAEQPGKAVGLELSRVRNAWMVGAVQKWWIRYSELVGKMPTMDFRAYLGARSELLLDFPMCVSKESVADAKP